ncbi:hypothetical protein L9F63_003155 [Diploptera punctata]|uniref:Threonine aspartase 1 n=1 Tax=Diploptera punctata TaxID=6984 RepID=A0AAD8EAA2_DIPPU|nr:hypothetical protein L9F63_003155 [Diploptera punctata]
MTGFVGIHLGAGQHSGEMTQTYKRLCHKACKMSYSILSEGGTALEAVTVVTAILEDCPQTNAGFGSNLTWDGNVECDASVMDGSTLHFGAVGAVSGVKNPIKLAQHICKKQSGTLALGRIPPCLLVGDGAQKWAEQANISIVPSNTLISEKAMRRYQHYKRKGKNQIITPLDTVGAVCLDSYGNVAAASSSGGIALKHPGRVGQAATFGCGCWATNEVTSMPAIATSTSGCGEHLVRTMLAREIALEVQKNSCTSTSLYQNIGEQESPFLREVDEKLAGIILLKWSRSDGQGDFLWAHSSKTMFTGYMWGGLKKPVARASELPVGQIPGSSITVEGISFSVNPTSNL